MNYAIVPPAPLLFLLVMANHMACCGGIYSNHQTHFPRDMRNRSSSRVVPEGIARSRRCRKIAGQQKKNH